MPYPVAAVRGKNFGALGYSDKILGTEAANLIGYWPMNEASGTNSDNAEGTAARDGTYTGVTLGQTGIGDGNTCPLFDGANDFNNIASASLGTAGISDNLTVALWAKVSGSGVWTDSTLRYMIRFTYSTTSDYISIIRSATNNRLQWSCEWGNGGAIAVLKNSVTETGWMHMAITINVGSDAVIAYYNGSPTGSPGSGLITQSDTTLDTLRTLISSDDVSSPANIWDGWLAHAAIWTTVLTPAEIATLAVV